MPHQRHAMKYTFGTSTQAASRLDEIAKFFNPLASRFVPQYADKSATCAVDLGCGPGFTTDMLSHATKCQETCGLDNSREFLAMARNRFTDCVFIEHDVTQVPFPATADIIYVRFLLSHLPHPVRLVNKWLTQLRPGGVLLVEEVEDIETEMDVFRAYLATSEAIVASQGASLYVGAELAQGVYCENVLWNECTTLPVPDSQAATWFLPNTQTIWEKSQVVLDRLAPAEREEIRCRLSEIKESGDRRSGITWKMRRLAVQRTPSG